MAKQRIDLDEEALGAARAELGATTIEETVNEGLRLVALRRKHRISDALDVLAHARLGDRGKGWR